MTDMIERVGKAIYDNMCLANPHVKGEWESLPWDLKSYYSEQGRAAIEAMKNPTAQMMDAMRLRWAVSSMRPPGDCSEYTFRMLYTDGINAALTRS